MVGVVLSNKEQLRAVNETDHLRQSLRECHIFNAKAKLAMTNGSNRQLHVRFPDV